MIDAKMIYIHTMGWQCTSLSFEYKMHNIKSVKKKHAQFSCDDTLWQIFWKTCLHTMGWIMTKYFMYSTSTGQENSESKEKIIDNNRSENLY